MSDMQKAEPREATPYEPPLLEEIGTIEDLTLAEIDTDVRGSKVA